MASRKKIQEKLTRRQQESQRIAREKAKKKFMQTTWRRCVMMSVVGMVSLVALYGWSYVESGRLSAQAVRLERETYQLTADAGFAVRDIFLDGRKATPLKEITDALGIDYGDPILAESVEELREKLMAIKRIQYVEIERQLPDTLHIHIIERKPVAVWQNEGAYSLIDITGTVMESCKNACPELPVVVGEDAPSQTPQLLAFLAKEPELYKQMKAAVRIGERRWNIVFKNGIEVKLPEKNPEAAWQQLAKMQKDEKLLNRNIQMIDLRVGDRVFIKPQPEANPAIPATAAARQT